MIESRSGNNSFSNGQSEWHKIESQSAFYMP